MRNLTVIVAMVVVSLFAQQASAQIQWNAECALEAAQKFSSCKAAGGKPFGCLITAGFHYWNCSGSTIARGPVRAAIVGRRAVRRFQ